MHNRNKRISALPEQIWSLISQIDELKGRWVGGAKLNPQALGRLKRSVLVTSTGASTRIEGARMSDEDIEKYMRGLALTKFTDRDKQEVHGYYKLLENIFGTWRQLTFSENAIKHLHQELLKYAEKDERHRGEYKKTENAIEAYDESGKFLGVVFAMTPAYPYARRNTPASRYRQFRRGIPGHPSVPGREWQTFPSADEPAHAAVGLCLCAICLA
jgi:hypothetical protein